eukprot:m.23936 g.23936  ORF g.23936 m.23936 type:complete len:533 (-) comp12992_c0_seq1:714-2312(-)
MEASGSMAACESATFAAVIDLDRNTGEFTCTKIVSPTNAIIRSTEDPATISIDSDSASAIEATDKNGKHSAQNPNATHKVPYGQHALRGRKHLTPPPGVELLLPDVPSAVTLPDLLRLLAPVRGYEVANIREFATPPNKNRRHSETATDTGVKTVGVDASANENPHGCHHTISRNDECPTAVCGASTDSSPDGGYPVLLRLTGERAVSRIAHAFQNAPYSSLEPDRRIALYRVVARTAVPPPRFDPCPICLDTLTPTDGGKTDTVTMLCSHSFHGDCLAQCLELRCPVCRYVPVGVVGNQCHDCDAEHGLWMCLVCGHLGCAREQWLGSTTPTGAIPSQQHALKHYDATGHSFAQAIDTQQVWNYATDGYAEWLGQGHGPADKLAEVQRPHPPAHSDPHGTPQPLSERDASEALALEYTHLLCSRLESDREQYRAEQSALERAERERVERSAAQLQEIRARKRQLEKDIERLRSAAAAAEKDSARLRQLTSNAASRCVCMGSDPFLVVTTLRYRPSVNNVIRPSHRPLFVGV